MDVFFNKTHFICCGTTDPPFSVNSLYRTTNGRIYKPVEVAEWEEAFKWQVKSLNKEIPLFKCKDLHAMFCWWNDRADVDNRLKMSMDAMNGVVYEDDSRLRAILSVKLKGKKSFLFCVSKKPFTKGVSSLLKISSAEEMKDIILKGEI
ncbi:MAG: RusA family crossover junction endodeoxyribonuclease [Lawsonibacter sp.]|jgi:Holliday junction resolvase RusA-like endonuclease